MCQVGFCASGYCVVVSFSPSLVRCSRLSSHSPFLSAFQLLNPTAAALAVALEFAPQSFGDAQIGSAPEAIHLAGEVGGNLRGADHQQHLVVLMGS